MQAVLKSAPADGVDGTTIVDRPTPEPGNGEVLIRVGAAAICGTDKHIYHWDPSIQNVMTPPRIYGHEFCGFVERLGPGLEQSELRPGMFVSAEMHVVCGECAQCRSGNGHICVRTKIYGIHEDGSFADFVKVPATNVIPLDQRYVPLEVGAFLDALGNAVHSTQLVDLAGKDVAITGFGPIGAMCAAIAQFCAARSITVIDVSDAALESAKKWGRDTQVRRLHTFNSRSQSGEEIKAQLKSDTDGGVDVLLEMSGAPSAINLGLDLTKMGGFVSLLGLPAGHAVTIDNYTSNIIFKGLTIQGVIGRRMYSTWQRMLSLLASGMDVSWIVQAQYDGLQQFHEGMSKFERHEALKVIFFPEGKEKAKERWNKGRPGAGVEGP